jgi:hypothetical protein
MKPQSCERRCSGGKGLMLRSEATATATEVELSSEMITTAAAQVYECVYQEAWPEDWSVRFGNADGHFGVLYLG